MRTLTFLSRSIHLQSGKVVPSFGDIRASVLALQLADTTEHACGVHVYAPDSTNVGLTRERCALLREYACYGLEHLYFIVHTNPIQALIRMAQTSDFDYLVCGQRGGEYATGMVPYILAKVLGLPLIEQIYSQHNGAILQYLPSGNRRSISLPKRAILVVHPLAECTAPYIYAKGQQCTITNATAEQSSEVEKSAHNPHDALLGTQAWQSRTVLRPRQRYHASIRIADNMPGTRRMHQALGEQHTQGEIVQTGTPVQHAERIIDILRSKHVLQKPTADR